jgi:tryptophan-rich sensory protein
MKEIIIIIPLLISFILQRINPLFGVDTQNNWYRNLKKSNFQPPGYVFGIVWTIIYLLIGYSIYLFVIYYKNNYLFNLALIIFIIQMFLNYSWTYVLNKFKNLRLSFYHIILITIFVIINVKLFYRIKPVMGYLLIPYMLWLLFASFLSYDLFIINN